MNFNYSSNYYVLILYNNSSNVTSKNKIFYWFITKCKMLRNLFNLTDRDVTKYTELLVINY